MRIRYPGELTPTRKDTTMQSSTAPAVVNAPAPKPVKPMAKPLVPLETPATKMMFALMSNQSHIFEGVISDEEKAMRGGRGVTAADVARNRKRNKAARRARAAQRAAGR